MDQNQIDITFTNLSQLSRAYGAPAVDMAARVLQRAAMGQLVGGAVFLLGGIGCGLIAAACIRRMREVDGLSDSMAADMGCTFGAIIGIFLALGGVISGILMLSDVWAWTALTDPDLALAHKVFGSMGGQ